jgi:uncharacterized membrane protein
MPDDQPETHSPLALGLCFAVGGLVALLVAALIELQHRQTLLIVAVIWTLVSLTVIPWLIQVYKVSRFSTPYWMVRGPHQ